MTSGYMIRAVLKDGRTKQYTVISDVLKAFMQLTYNAILDESGDDIAFFEQILPASHMMGTIPNELKLLNISDL